MDNKTEKTNKNIKKNKNKVKIKFSSIFLLLLVTLSGYALYLNAKYKKEGNEIIRINVNEDKKTDLTDAATILNIHIYNTATKIVETKSISVEKKDIFIEGDYVDAVIENTPFLKEDMKFHSAYKLKQEDGSNKQLIKLSSSFKSLRSNKEQYDGFVKSIEETIKQNYKDIQVVEIKIDGDSEE